MDTKVVADLLREGVNLVIKICGPMLLLSMLVGVVIAIFQAVTQIHEQTIGFVLKLAVVVAFLLIAGNWMLTNLQDYTKELFLLMLE